jgi:hypothetical protein
MVGSRAVFLQNTEMKVGSPQKSTAGAVFLKRFFRIARRRER